MSNVLAVIGAQYGSEGKGVIVNKLANKFDIHVRVGGPNAGHSFKHEGRTIKQRSVPCGWTNPNAIMVIGRGAIIDPEVLIKEVKEIEVFDPNIRNRLLIDENAWVITPWDREAERDRGMRESIGSTLEGVGVARALQLARDPGHDRRAKNFGQDGWAKDFRLVDTVNILHANGAVNSRRILLEGTQGTGLSLVHGQWPYCTSSDITTGSLASAVGIPCQIVDCMLVARTFPIRVAGNSGPMFHEVTWDYISDRMGRETVERTTVTKNVRRIGMWDTELFQRSVWLNGPRWLAITFADYLDPTIEMATDYFQLTPPVRDFISMVERVAGCPVAMVGTGGPNWSVIEMENIK